MNIRELEEASGLPARLIRYLISEGVIPGPEGTTRSASYGQAHISALATYSQMKGRGVSSLQVIRSAISNPSPSDPLIVSPTGGVEIRIDPSSVAEIDTELILAAIRKALEDLKIKGETP